MSIVFPGTANQIIFGTGNVLTLNSVQSTSQTLNVPDITASDTIATLSAIQTLTNKTLTSPIVNGGSIDAATVGLTTASTGRFTTVTTTNATSLIMGPTNPVSLTITTQTVGSAVLAVPNLAGVSDTLMTLGTVQTITGVKTFSAAPVISTITNTGTLTLPATTDTLVGRNTSDTLTNKLLNNPTVFHVDGTDTTKRIGFQTSGATTATTLTLASIATVNRTITFPNATDTVVLVATAQTLTSKTLTSPTINTATISGGTINNATIGATTATTGRFTTVTATQITNQIALGTTNVLTINSSQTSPAQTLTIPNLGGVSDTMMVLGTAQTITGVKTFSASPVMTSITNGGTVTIPSGTDTFAVLGAAQTFTAVKTFSVAPNMSSLTASQVVVTDGSKNLASSFVYSIATAASSFSVRDANSNLSANNMIVGYTSTATAAGTTVLTVSSPQLQFFTGSTTQTITLPDTPTLVTGQTWTIKNLSSGNLTINAFAAPALVATVLPGDDVTVTCISTVATTNVGWDARIDGSATQLRTAGSPVILVAGTAPSTGHVLTATSSTTAGWAAPAATGITSLNSLTAASQTFAVSNLAALIAFTSSVSTHTLNIPDADASFRGVVSIGTQTFGGAKTFNTAVTISAATNQLVLGIGTPLTITSAQTTTQTITIPNVGAGDSFTTNNFAATLTNKTLIDATTFFADDLDNTKRMQFQLSGITTATTRTLTIPNTSDTIAVLALAQTFTNKTLTSPTINTATISGGTINNATIGATTATTGRFTTVAATSLTNQFAVGTPANVTTLNFPASTGAVTLAFPNITDTVVARTTADTLTNKTITGTTNNVSAKSLLSATTTIDVFASAAPTNGQVLTATSSTTATWQTPSGGATAIQRISVIAPAVSSPVTTNDVVFITTTGTGAATGTLGTATDGKTIRLIYVSQGVGTTYALSLTGFDANGGAMTTLTFSKRGHSAQLTWDNTILAWFITGGAGVGVS